MLHGIGGGNAWNDRYMAEMTDTTMIFSIQILDTPEMTDVCAWNDRYAHDFPCFMVQDMDTLEMTNIFKMKDTTTIFNMVTLL